MTRLLLVVSLLVWAVPVSAQNWIVQNGANTATCSSANPCVVVDQKGSGSILVLRRNGVAIWALDFSGGQALTGIFTVTNSGLGTTSTDGIVVQNATLATSGTTVQMSPRVRLRSNVWNTTATAANNTDDWWIESVPVSDTTPIGQLQFFHSANGAAGAKMADLNDLGQFGVKGSGRFYFFGSTLLTDLTNGVLTLRVNAGTAGFGLDGRIDNILRVRARTDASAYAGVEAAGDLTAGSQVPTANGRLQTAVYKVVIPYTDAAFIAAAAAVDVTIATLPAKTFVSHVLADLTTTFACSATCTTATLSATVGKTAGGNEYLLSFDADAAAAQFGDAAAELGASLTPATVATLVGDLASWSGTTAATIRLTSAVGNIGTGAATNLSQGSVTLYLTTTKMP